MISPESYGLAWIAETRRRFPRADPGLIEKVIRALSLLEQLVVADFDIVFKGGTAVLLSLDRLDRFSIDIDVAMPQRPPDFEGRLKRAVIGGGFEKLEVDKRKERIKVDKEHYKFFFKSVTTKLPTCILLDVIFDQPTYAKTLTIPIESRFVKTSGESTLVRAPRVEGLLADKLATFAPNTIGIAYGHGKGLNIAKQLYDISRLFDAAADFAAVKEDFVRLVPVEARYKALKEMGADGVLDDCFDASLTVVRRGWKPEQHDELMTGVKALRAFLFQNTPTTREDAVMWAGKTAYLSRILKQTGKQEVQRYLASQDLSTWKVDGADFNQLNRIKKYSPEGFFYWHEAVRLHRKLQS